MTGRSDVENLTVASAPGDAAAELATVPVRRGAARPAPARNPRLAHLDLAELRRYRGELTAEEGRVSYWRRVVATRLDLLRATQDGGEVVDTLRDLRTGLPVQIGRATLLGIVDEDLPTLPDLGRLWLSGPAPVDELTGADRMAALEEGERVLEEYRSAVVERLEAATAELIARYRDEPTACLAALPHQRRRGAGHGAF